ncbi:chromatin remodeling complex Adenosinetriphosphatase [Yamadazyma tenuis]|uniref:Chromatin remodelling complex ATPase chain ISW1 n=1 Tax=Candida tenuis (strain ATCC 10573 / BCRC 21748 / CBS 615 / JCM 9827 / NBRC 10315 / NRRL Y-1498 / VKM Y-70) TaxID=590646 RepID=G3B769_CANTC|nr:chromatin remodelling complex ATPase chain ISW1 [Yamadazyma tenuis ATCC 10573]EGV61581.1 chromatin remodelling complex ATPase chain ISW1 [Yamadazyma tenuis ATCC 10573]WEJ92803.1 chromatin remodeling complex Adenosinetriphosphatase [Yamadazyma tenuis]
MTRSKNSKTPAITKSITKPPGRKSVNTLSKFRSESHDQRLKRFLLSTDAATAKKNDVDDSTVRFKHLLALTPLFRYFIDLSASKDVSFKKVIRQLDNEHSIQLKDTKKRKRRKTEKEEDAELLEEEIHVGDGDQEKTVMVETPSYVHGKLRDYQIQGLNWLISLYENRLSGILADEMGLGKTLQTISFLGYLRYIKHIDGPFVVIVPKSTLDNWRREFAKWTPEVNVVVLQGNKEQRTDIMQNQLLTAKFDVLVTSFEMVIREKSQLKKFKWEYIVVDEAHRIKNEESSLSQIIRLFYSRNRLLITGTPLQNNLHELWALLNFLLPDVFGDSEVFDEWFDNQGGKENPESQDQDQVVQQLHQLLSPFLLRRVKADVEKSLLPKIETNVYIGMTDMQRKWYRQLLEKDIDAVNGAVGKREGKTRLLNIVMQLRKCCNHPYLFDGAEPGPPFTTDEHLVFNAGKMIILDKMLSKFKREGSRVLIFSQMSRLLDILEDYCFLREYNYCRIDGSTSHEERIQAIDDYNAPDSEKFIFLLTTRAGGLGINLTTADIVILYDSDWNPQADLQAMDRAHRIGQKKQVKVFRFVSENAIEEKVLERAAQKLRLDQLVIQQGRSSSTAAIGSNKDDLIGMIQHGAQEVFQSDKTEMFDDDIDAILQRGAEKTKTLNSKFNKLGLDDIQNFAFDNSTWEWNGQNFSKKENDKTGVAWINPSKRERKEQTYSIDNYYKDVLKATLTTKATNSQLKAKAPKHYNIQDHQFFPDGLAELLEREQLQYKQEVGYKYSVDEFGDSDEEFLADEFKSDVSREERRRIEQKKVDSVIPLTEEETKAKDQMLSESFYNWTRRDFTNFIHGCAKHGRNSFEQIAKSVGTKTPEEVQQYSQTFWKKYTTIEGYEKYITQIESSEKKSAKLQKQQEILHSKMSQIEDPLSDLTIAYPPNNSKRVYSKLEDRFILACVYKHGIFSENLSEKVREEVSLSDLFRFDWFMLSRTAQELGRRINTLLLALTREVDTANKKKSKLPNIGSSANSTRPGSTEPSAIPNGAGAKRNGDENTIAPIKRKKK